VPKRILQKLNFAPQPLYFFAEIQNLIAAGIEEVRILQIHLLYLFHCACQAHYLSAPFVVSAFQPEKSLRWVPAIKCLSIACQTLRYRFRHALVAPRPGWRVIAGILQIHVLVVVQPRGA
jgi:hypothetical protein